MITVWVKDELIRRSSGYELCSYLRSKGLNTNMKMEQFVSPQKPLMAGFQGTALPDRVVGVTRTVIGVVPVTAPWKGAK